MLKHLLSGPPALQLAVAESMTGGRLQALITAESGASAFFLGGLTAYTLAQKIRHLGVAREIAEPVDCVSAEVAPRSASRRSIPRCAAAMNGCAAVELRVRL